MMQLKKFMKDDRGQGMTEYILIIVLIAIAAIVAFRYFSTQLNSKASSTADTVYSTTEGGD